MAMFHYKWLIAIKCLPSLGPLLKDCQLGQVNPADFLIDLISVHSDAGEVANHVDMLPHVGARERRGF